MLGTEYFRVLLCSSEIPAWLQAMAENCTLRAVLSLLGEAGRRGGEGKPIPPVSLIPQI